MPTRDHIASSRGEMTSVSPYYPLLPPRHPCSPNSASLTSSARSARPTCAPSTARMTCCSCTDSSLACARCRALSKRSVHRWVADAQFLIGRLRTFFRHRSGNCLPRTDQQYPRVCTVAASPFPQLLSPPLHTINCFVALLAHLTPRTQQQAPQLPPLRRRLPRLLWQRRPRLPPKLSQPWGRTWRL